MIYLFICLSGRQRLRRLIKPSVNEFIKILTCLCIVVENVSYETILKGIFSKYIKMQFIHTMKIFTAKNYLYGIFK